MTKNKKYIILIAIEMLIIIAVLTLDLLTKHFIYGPIAAGGSEIILIKGFLEFTAVENTGASFGMFAGRTTLLTIISLIATVCLLVFCVLSYKNRNSWLRTSLILIIAGSAGNLYDRLVFGYVRDFIYFSFIDFPVFNIADNALTIGCITLMVYILFFYKPDVKTVKVNESSSITVEKDKLEAKQDSSEEVADTANIELISNQDNILVNNIPKKLKPKPLTKTTKTKKNDIN